MPLALAIIPVLFGPEERQKATAVMASTIFLSFPIGPLVGGSLLDHFWWGSVFLINVPGGGDDWGRGPRHDPQQRLPGRLSSAGLPAPVADAAKGSVAAGVVVAHKLRSASLLELVRTAFVHGMDIMLWMCGGIALVSALLALAFLPRRAHRARRDAGLAESVAPGTGETGSQRAELGL